MSKFSSKSCTKTFFAEYTHQISEKSADETNLKKAETKYLILIKASGVFKYDLTPV